MRDIKKIFKFFTALLLFPLVAMQYSEKESTKGDPLPKESGIILVNHVGFLPNAPKHCVIPKPPEKTFSIYRLKDTKFTQVFTDTLREGGNELEHGWIGDFTALKEDGIYQVRCGSLKSRCFTIQAGVYDMPKRIMFNYFSFVRCGDTTGKSCTGPCHLDDGFLVGSGHRDFSGGYHQSSDLRKWPWGLNLGLIGLVQFGAIQKPFWDRGCITEEVRWGCDYYQKLLRSDGGMYDCVFIPIHWGSRDYYPTDPPAPALWNTILHQALAADYFKDKDADYAAKCRQTAENIWKYMILGKRPQGTYNPPAMPPLGHEALKTNFSNFYEGSAQELAHRMRAALALYRVSGDSTLLNDAAQSATKLVNLQVINEKDGNLSPLFWEGPEGDRLASTLPGFGYFGNGPIMLGLCEMVAAAPKHQDAARWRKTIQTVSAWYCEIAKRNPWGLVATNFTLSDNPCVDNNQNVEGFYPGIAIHPRSESGTEKFMCYQYRRYLYHYDIALAGLFLNRAADITGNNQCRVIAQRQLDWIMGCNPFDASAIEGVGYNQPAHGLFGEFFPPTPQIPGAVSISLNRSSFDPQDYGFANEIDMPVSGNVLWLMEEQSR